MHEKSTGRAAGATARSSMGGQELAVGFAVRVFSDLNIKRICMDKEVGQSVLSMRNKRVIPPVLEEL